MNLQEACTYAAFIGLVGVVVDLLVRRLSGNKLPHPPGPPRLPIIGNLRDMPWDLAWEKYHAWCKEYNTDILELNILGKSIVVLDTIEAVNELLDKRSAIYSNRPRMPMVTELMGWDFNIGTMPYGPDWRAHRRIFEQSFNASSAHQFEPTEVASSRKLLRNLLQDPKGFMSHVRHYAGSTILSITYGIEIRPKDDPYIKLSEDGIQPVLQAVVPGRYLVDIFPVLKHVPDWMPFATFKRVARETRELSKRMAEVPYQVTKRAMACALSLQATGTFTPSFVSSRLQALDESKDTSDQERLVRNAAATMYSSGSDNTVSTILGFFLAVLSNPEAQAKAQKEIDSVIANGELPTFEDRDSLPYVTALVTEVLRWCLSSPLGGPHVLQEDDVYNGYRLKAGSMVFANIWAIFHNEATYPDPFTFKPERFLKKGKFEPVQEISTVFGFGRR
ncbi:hypothetical protein CVT26_014939 [Gymnopilus dilepis]|uniref:Cytochrome P450 n=1 Tax=Gymnopilus dilepis TaxID=231916 RepID=A0A409XWV9_9AGAR|nr:hypothetical protein CVT26_014939 [Gymnopilus dilepis]